MEKIEPPSPEQLQDREHERNARLVEAAMPAVKEMVNKKFRNVTQRNIPCILVAFSGRRFHFSSMLSAEETIKNLKLILQQMERRRDENLLAGSPTSGLIVPPFAKRN